ncbi:MAG: helix-turn-helix domain-containing protein [Nitrospirota bacterium]|nr:helix-turn-helix domain-containing protein [Nitrospirota bacterium]
MLKKIEDMNHYELLEVSPRATAQEIHKAYERIRKIYDPNSIALYSLFSPEETEIIRQRIEDAYRTLIYDENRRAYDLSLRSLPDALPPDHPRQRTFATPLPPSPRTEPVRTPEPHHQDPRPVPHAPETAAAQEPLRSAPADITEFTGPMLKMLREQRGLSVQNIADITKMSTRYIESIESENYQKLPARPYLRGFLVIYTKAVGYEPDRIVTDYMRRFDAARNPAKK